MSLRLKFAATSFLFLCTIVTTGFGPPSLAESNNFDTAVSPAVLRQIRQDLPPALQARAAVLVDAVTGTVLFQKDAHQRRANASTTKMMTALVTLERAKLSDVVTAGSEVLGIEPTIIGLEPGDRLTVEQMLYGLLLPSGNDAAVALAVYVGGDAPRFVEMMNDRAIRLGLSDTHFVNPNGLDADGHYSSAYDLAMIAREGLKDPVFERIVRTREYIVPGPPRWLFRTTNQLLGVLPGADGVKTGYTDNAGRCLVLSATREGRRVIAVVMDSDATWSDASALLEYFFSNFGWGSPGVSGSPLANYETGDVMRTSSAGTMPEIVAPNWQLARIKWFFELGHHGSSSGGSVGTASYFLFGRKAGEIELFDRGD